MLNNSAVVPKTHPSFSHFFSENGHSPAQEDLLVLIVIGFIAAAGFYCLSQAYRLAQPSMIAPFEYIAVPLSVIWGYMFFKDTLDYQSVTGMMLVVGSGLYIFRTKLVWPTSMY